jgi:mRNA-degrading endonuclease RelE of RelBE toxin-antitoxin system
MSFSVMWSPNAEKRLAHQWLEVSDRSQIARAANEIDSLLASRALEVGESRAGNRRILHSFPLGVIYSVNEQAATVLVIDVWRHTKR